MSLVELGRAEGRSGVLGRLVRPAAVAAAVGLPALALWAVASRSYFVFDDFYNLRVALDDGLTLHLLRAPIFQHFAPGHHLLDWLTVTYFPGRFGPPLALLLALYVGAALLLQGSLDTLFGRRSGTVALTALFASSLFTVSQLDWLASGEHAVPATFFTLLSLYGYVRYAVGRRGGWIVLSVAAYCLGLLFLVRPLLLPFVLLALRLLFLGDERDIRPRRAVAVVVREWRVWVSYAVPSVLYLVNYFHGYWQATPRPGVRDLLDFLQLGWFRTFAPGFVGVLPVHRLDAAGIAAVAGSQALLVLLFAAGGRLGARPWRSAVFLVGVFLANMLLAGLPRVGIFGVGVAFDTRYFMELSWLLPLALGFALMRSRRPYAGLHDPRVPDGGRRVAPAVAAIVVAALGAHAGLAWHAASGEVTSWFGSAAKGYFANLTSGLGDSGGGNLADVALPEWVVGSWIAPYNYLSTALPVVRRPLSYDDFTRPLLVPDSAGRLRPAIFDGVAGGALSRLGRRARLKLSGARREGAEACVASGKAASVMVTLTPPVAGPRYFLRLGVRGTGIVAPATQAAPGAGLVPAPPLVVRRGEPAFGVLNAQRLYRLDLVIRARSRLCLAALAVGTFVPGGQPG